LELDFSLKKRLHAMCAFFSFFAPHFKIEKHGFERDTGTDPIRIFPGG
jgi:hypothetical protein